MTTPAKPQWLSIPGGLGAFDLPKRGAPYRLLGLSFYVNCTSDPGDRWPRLLLYLAGDGPAFSPLVTAGKLIADDYALVFFSPRSAVPNTISLTVDGSNDRIIVTGEFPQDGLYVSTESTLTLIVDFTIADVVSNITALIQEC